MARHFKGIYHHHLQGKAKTSRSRQQTELSLHCVSQKHEVLSELHGVTEAGSKCSSACQLLLLVSCSAYSSVLKMAVICSSKLAMSYMALQPKGAYSSMRKGFTLTARDIKKETLV
jgi:hypothetical protein